MVHHDGCVYPLTIAGSCDGHRGLCFGFVGEKSRHYCCRYPVSCVVCGVSYPYFGGASVLFYDAFPDLVVESLHYLHQKRSFPVVAWSLFAFPDQTDRHPHDDPRFLFVLDLLGLSYVLDSLHLFHDLDALADECRLQDVYVEALDHGCGDHQAV